MDSFSFLLLLKEQLVMQQNGGPRKVVMQLLSEKTPNKLKQNICLINCLFFRLLTLGKVEGSQHKKC